MSPAGNSQEKEGQHALRQIMSLGSGVSVKDPQAFGVFASQLPVALV